MLRQRANLIDLLTIIFYYVLYHYGKHHTAIWTWIYIPWMYITWILQPRYDNDKDTERRYVAVTINCRDSYRFDFTNNIYPNTTIAKKIDSPYMINVPKGKARYKLSRFFCDQIVCRADYGYKSRTVTNENTVDSKQKQLLFMYIRNRYINFWQFIPCCI